jgi:hypothetical protein
MHCPAGARQHIKPARDEVAARPAYAICRHLIFGRLEQPAGFATCCHARDAERPCAVQPRGQWLLLLNQHQHGPAEAVSCQVHRVGLPAVITFHAASARSDPMA